MTSDPAVATHAPRRRQRQSREPRHRLLRPVVTWSIIAALLAAATLSSIGAVNENVYGAGNFVREYLNTLSSHDAQAALEIPGVDVTSASLAASGLPTDASRVLLRDSQASDIRNISVVSDQETKPGLHNVTVDYVLDSKPQRSTFALERVEPRFGVFQSWRFATSPIAAVSLTVLHETIFDVNGLKLDVRSTQPDQPDAFAAQADYLVFTPGAYTFSHESRLLTSKPVTARVTTPSSSTTVEVDAAANPAFVASVQTEVNSYLDDCALQKVLLPSGCPFGQFIENRLQGLPMWTITTYPPVRLGPNETHWEMPATKGTAHLSGEVQSLFDGSISELDEDVPFTMALTASIRSDGSLDIRVQ